MKLWTVIITALIISLFSCSGAFCKEKKATPVSKPAFIASVESIARGKTFTDQNAQNVSFTLQPTRAYIKISF